MPNDVSAVCVVSLSSAEGGKFLSLNYPFIQAGLCDITTTSETNCKNRLIVTILCQEVIIKNDLHIHSFWNFSNRGERVDVIFMRHLYTRRKLLFDLFQVFF